MKKKKRNEFNETFFFGCICWDCSFSVAEFSISQSCSCEHVNRLTSHSKNLGNIKVKVTLTTRKPPHQISDQRNCPISLLIFFFKEGRG